MPELFTDIPRVNKALADKSVDELLLLVADDDQGLQPAAIEMLLAMDFATIYPQLEMQVRNGDDANRRNSAMEVLVKFGKQSVPRLIKLLRDGDEEVRNFAAVMLGDIGNREAVSALIRALSDKDLNVSHAAAEALGKIGDRAALLPLIDLLKGDFWVQYAAIAAIGAMRNFRAVPHLLHLLDNELLAGPVIQALGEIGDPRALYPLCNILPYVDDALAGQTVRSIVAISRNIIETLKYKNSLSEFSQPGQLRNLINDRGVSRLHALLEKRVDPPTMEAAVTLLGWIGDSAAIECFFTLLDDPQFVPAVESAILALGKTAAPSLIAALAHPNDKVKIVAIRSLRWLGEPGANRLLTGLITFPGEDVQLEALETLKECPVQEMLPELYQLSLHDNPEISSRAAEALGNFPLSMIQPFLDSILHSGNVVIRIRAAALLGYLPNGGGADLLGILAADHDPQVRCEALKSAGRQRVHSALPLLRQNLTDPDTAVREAAIMALAEFGVPNFSDELLAVLDEGNEQLDYAVIKALGMMGAKEAGSALMAFLQDKALPRSLEYGIIETLGKISCTAASGLLTSRYLQHPDPDIRRLAVETLGTLGDLQSLKSVEGAVLDPHWSVRVATLHVLAKIGGARELPLLLAAMEDKDFLVRKHAILALGDVRDSSTVPALAHQLIDMEMSKYAFESLLRFGKMALPWLHRLMTKNSLLELRIRVIDLVGKISDHKSVEPLLGLLEESSADIRLAAIDSLTFCYDSLPLKKLASIKKNDGNDEVKERAALALKTFLMEKYF